MTARPQPERSRLPAGVPAARVVAAPGTPLDLRAWARAYVRAILDAEGITLDAPDQRDAA